jgi:hypothetical protein
VEVLIEPSYVLEEEGYMMEKEVYADECSDMTDRF